MKKINLNDLLLKKFVRNFTTGELMLMNETFDEGDIFDITKEVLKLKGEKKKKK